MYILQFIIAIHTRQYDDLLSNNEKSTPLPLDFDSLNYADWEYHTAQNSVLSESKSESCAPTSRSFCLRLSNILMIMIGIISTINMFRGYWFLLDEYFLKDHYELSLIHGQIYGALILMVSFAGCSLHAGIFRDDYVGAKCLIEFYYTSYFYIKV